jgi:hypothetical protein
MSLPSGTPNAFAFVEQDAATREREERRKRVAEEIRRKDEQRASEREQEREREAYARGVELKEKWRRKMSTMMDYDFESWWAKNHLRIKEEEARAGEAQLAAGNVGDGYGVL